MYTYSLTQTHIHMHTYLYMHTHIHLYTHIHAYTQTHMHSCTQAQTHVYTLLTHILTYKENKNTHMLIQNYNYI